MTYNFKDGVSTPKSPKNIRDFMLWKQLCIKCLKQQANKFIKASMLREKNMRVFIPRNFVESFGVCRTYLCIR